MPNDGEDVIFQELKNAIIFLKLKNIDCSFNTFVRPSTMTKAQLSKNPPSKICSKALIGGNFQEPRRFSDLL